MEALIPVIAFGGLYIIFNQKRGPMLEGFDSLMHTSQYLKAADIPDRNYPDQHPEIAVETDVSSKLSTANKYHSDNGAYTDKYFNANLNKDSVVGALNNMKLMDVPENNSKKYFSLTGDQVDESYFSSHSNPVPFFGGHIRSRNVNSNANESILDNMTGAGSQIHSKKEQSPLFSPADHYQFPNGAPNSSDFYQSRVNPSLRMANVKPFQEEQVGPGLGLGYTTEGQGGFNSGMMARDQWTEKTVDQLRTDNKPKASGLGMLGYEGPAMSHVTHNIHKNHIGNVEKNRPERTFDHDPSRYMTTTGAGKGQTLRSIEIERNVSRPETSTEYSGIAGFGVSSTYIDGEYMPSKHVDLGPVPISVANAVGRGGANVADYGSKSYNLYSNNRVANNQDSYFGIIGSSIGAVVAPVLDMLRPSRKENTIGTLRPYQNAVNSVGSTYIFNPADRAATTIRETTENSKFHLNVNANQLGGAYQTTEHQSINNQRDSTTDFYYAGGSSAAAGSRETTSYEAGYRQRNNDIKSSTIDGRLVKGNMSLYQGDINMSAKPKDTMLKNSRSYAPSMPNGIPSAETLGRLQGTNGLYSNIQLDRNSSDVLSSLKSNPYALSVTSAI